MDSIKKLFSFKGRNNRRTYWIFSAIALVISVFLAPYTSESDVLSIFLLIFLPFYLWCSIAMLIKRCHDLNKSGWWALLTIIPIINLWIFFQLAYYKGDESPNKFGCGGSCKEEAQLPLTRNQTSEEDNLINPENTIPPVPFDFHVEPKQTNKRSQFIWGALGIVILGLSLIYWNSESAKQRPSNIVGTYMINGYPISQALVTLTNPNNEQKTRVYTLEDGQFKFENLIAGTYSLGSGIKIEPGYVCVSNNDTFTTKMIFDGNTNVLLVALKKDSIEIPPNYQYEIYIDLTCYKK